MAEPWVEGLQILRQRQRNLPQTVIRALTAPIDLSAIDLTKYRSILTTGIGSSAAHSRYLSWLLQKYCGLNAGHVSSGAFISAPPPQAGEEALIVFSQGLSPNARLPLSWAGRFGATILITAADSETGERAEAVQRAQDSGVIVIPIPVDPEYEVLLRIAGPAAGYAVALRLAARCGSGIEVDPNEVASAMHDAAVRAETLLRGADERLLSDPITFVTTHGYGDLASNLSSKVVEGMFLAAPAVVDALEFAHGSLQEAAGKHRTFIALTRHAPYEAELFARVRASLEPQHRWLELEALLPEPFHMFEHEAAMNILVLDAIARRRIDQRDWPGCGSDRHLYSIASVQDLEEPIVSNGHTPQPNRSRRLEDLTWPEIEERVRAGDRTVVIPLGAIEQHGPHLPLAVDTMIASALAERFCCRVPGALQAPTLHLGCSSEHMAFCGTLSLEPSTFRAVLRDMVSSLVGHGFTHVVIFSAHGGNDALLAEMETDLKVSAAPARITVVHGIERLSKTWAGASALEGVPAEISGQHAGEFETSIIAGLRSDAIRWPHMRAGLTSTPDSPQNLFYPSLKNHAPDGVVGDPRAAAAERAERYLGAWVDLLVAEYYRTCRGGL